MKMEVLESVLGGLPTELVQYIVYLLPTNADRLNLAFCSSKLAYQILPPESHIWRKLFRDSYDDNYRRSLVEYKIDYQIRSIILRRQIDFKYGQKEKQAFWLMILAQLLGETMAQEDVSEPENRKNLGRIREALIGSEFLNRPLNGYMMQKRDPPSNLFCAVQLALTYMALDLSMEVRCLRTDYDIRTAYEYYETGRGLLHRISSLSTENLLHIRNFWLRHLLNPDEGTFYTSYKSLPEYHRPGPPKFGHEVLNLHSSWLGYKSCICPSPSTTSALESRQTCADLNGDHMVEVEPITLELEEQDDAESWPALFQSFYSLGNSHDSRKFFRGAQTYTESGGIRISPVRGFKERVDGGEMPGCWARICFVVYKRPGQEDVGNSGGSQKDRHFNEDWPPIDIVSDFSSIIGYEGIIVPGGSLILGKWSNLQARGEEMGPFIFWCI